ncbi:LysM peptidoglycan-binding domain-containing protein [Roseomonas sp. AR75]|uniref:LysM peptidoglycan-binding domain-containing protein n=1 Tax=Roseomonas sp. AR75 TaxID=2562311 RepID=UPI0010C05772|nr:LysM peptidoglycan-binding domain-containing protein [Roseomonas sp. AR75]
MTASGRALLIVVAVTAGLAGFVASRFVALAPQPAPSADVPVAVEPRPPAAQASATPRPVAASSQPTAPAAPEPPRFDVVRIGARGGAVVAGRAAAGAEVVLMEEGREMGRARADSRGEWVILPPDPLPAGTRHLTLLARLGGEDMPGPDTVVVVVPEAPALAEAPRLPAAQALPPPAPAAAAGPPLAVSTPAAVAMASALPSGPGEAALPALPRPAIGPATPAPQPAGTATPATRPAASPSSADPPASPPATPAPPVAAEAPRAIASPGQPAAPAAPARIAATGQPLVVLLPGAQPEARVLQAPAPRQGLALGQVDYDQAGAIRFAGTAAPGATVRLYVNDRHTGDAQADDQGRWSLAPGEAIAIGRHRLRVDQVAAAGAVAARIEVPFQRDRLPESETAHGRVIVQPGHSLWRMARSVYGQGVRYTVIYEANREQIRNPHRIFPGQVFAMPGMAPDGGETAPAESSRSR